MKKAISVVGIGILGAVLISFTGSHDCEKKNRIETTMQSAETHRLFLDGWNLELSAASLETEDIVYIEDENFELGFDTADYLPLGFNAYEGMELELADIEYIREEDEVVLDFNTKDYLPEGFTTSAK